MNSSFFLVKWLFIAMDWVYRQMCGLFSEGGWVVVLTIFLFTLAIKLLTIFSDIKSRKSSIQMQAIQPDIEKLKKKYGNDPQKLNIEQRKLMKERGVSTLGGCLPILIMMPLLFMFFAAFRTWSSQQALALVLKSEYNPTLNQIALNQDAVNTFAHSRFLWITNIWRPDNLNAGGTLMNGSEFWNTFAAGNNVKDFIFYNNNSDALNRILYELHFFTRTLGENGTYEYVLANDGGAAFKAAYDAFISPITSRADLIGGAYEKMSNGFAILPILAGATTFLTSWLTQRSQKKALGQTGESDAQKQTQGMNKVMMFLMPAMSIFFCYQYDSTFAFYWIFSNVISLAITLILNATVFKKMQTETVEVIKK
ncbi:MAG: YidC/Oxa1 family membrane protein insertase [Clostridia bacterium]|nr:YidC/Oxa1 family membrane protein insertase [Clostridia bacterium]